MEYNRCFSEKSNLVQSLLRDPVTSIFKKWNVRLSTNCPLFAPIIQNPKNHALLVDLGFLSPSDLKPSLANQNAFFFYSWFLRQYVTPTLPIQLEVRNRLADHANRTLLCLHIRCGNPLADFKDQASFLGLRDISKFQTCRKNLLKNGTTTILTSDSTRAKTMIRNYRPGDDVVWFDAPAVHTMTRHMQRAKLSGLQQVAADLFTLASCDEFVGTYRSSFSVAASALIGKKPFLVQPTSGGCSIPKTIRFG